ncbi:MAG: carbon-nitrogen hydrolase family protein [Novosphingobium sp.]
MSVVTIAAAQYPIDWLADWGAYESKLSLWVRGAAEQGARLAVFPEYGAMELASLAPDTAGSLHGSLESVAALAERVDDLHAGLAREYGLLIVAGSLPWRLDDGRFVNRARIFSPNGRRGFQDKLVMTRFENEQWHVSPGSDLTVFNTDIGKLGIAICYDSEFPLIARALCEAGVEILAVPTCTDTVHGYWRVRLGCQARALENQCLVVQSPTVGLASWSPAVDENRGAAGFYCPPDGAFPDDGVVATGMPDQSRWVVASVDLASLRDLRADGAVLNALDWQRQPGAKTLRTVRTVDLRS